MVKRGLLAGLLILVLALMQSERPGPAVAVTPIQGDVNCSGGVNAVDALQVLRSVAGLTTNAACLLDAGDTNCDTNVNAIDALRILRFVAGLTNSVPTGCAAIGETPVPPTGEQLIAAALSAGTITYEQSLLYRAYALFADPRLPAGFSSPVMDWEAGTELFGEIDENESQIGPVILAALEEFRARPNDPASIHYATPESVAVTAQAVAPTWQTVLVPGTGARVWALGAAGAEQKYVNLVSTVWAHFLPVFAYPNPDQSGDPSTAVNPDDAIDFYFVNPGIDPRYAPCQVPNPDPKTCLTASDFGMARRAPAYVSNTSSGYLIVNAARVGADPLLDDNLVDTIAHELAHVSQYAYDTGEASWLYESTATWIAYRIMLDMGRKPQYAYDVAASLYELLERPLNNEQGDNARYRSWLFFQHAAMVAGDTIVSAIWDQAKPAGKQGINAVDAAFKLDTHFDDFTVRNWNVKPPIPIRYKDAPDPNFPDSLKPDPDRDLTLAGEATDSLDLPVEPLSARYYRYVFQSPIRHIIFENNLVQTAGAHVWLLEKIAGAWKPPQDMVGSPVQTWCRDSSMFEEDLEELIVIVSFSEISGPSLNHHFPRVITDPIGCFAVEGWAQTTLHVVDDLQDITYNSGLVNLRFVPRAIQDEPGNVQYDLSGQSQGVHWVASGTYADCPAEGETTVLFPGVPYDPAEITPAGYLNVVAPGDFHSVIIRAYDPAANITVTCPGNPAFVYETGFDALYLLLIVSESNTYQGGQLVLEGDQFLVFGNQTYHFTWHLVRSDPPAP